MKKNNNNTTRNIFIIKACNKIIIILGFLFIISFLNKNKFERIENGKINPRKYSYYDEHYNGKTACDFRDPINVFKNRIKNKAIEICKEKNIRHICYINNEKYNQIFFKKNGTFCTMENIVLDPQKSIQTKLVYKGPVDKKNRGLPILLKGFFNTECNPKKIEFKFNKLYENYFNSWNYDYNIENETDIIEELAPGKIVLFLSRNQDSPNLFFGNNEIINIISMLYLFNLSPEDIKVVFMESIEIPQDPFYDIYKNMISLGGEPVHIKNLKKKYKISKAIHVPILWDNPSFNLLKPVDCDSITKTYQLYNDLIDKYMNIKPFIDTFILNENISYYPEKIINSHKKNNNFTKKVTIQWRRVWPKGRKGQFRLLNNGPQLADKLASVLPNNILIRLINTASLSIREQISLMRNTNYFVGIHGAGLSLSIFLPKLAICHEISHKFQNNRLHSMSSMSGHITYSDILKSEINKDDGNENISLDENEFINSVLNHMKQNNFFSNLLL